MTGMPASLKSAWSAYREGEPELALKEFEELAAGDSSPHPLIQKGLFFFHLERHVEAVTTFEEAIKLQPQNPAALFFHALALELSGEVSQSQSAVAKLREVCPHHQGIPSLILLSELRHGDPLPHLVQMGYGSGVENRRPSAGFSRSLLVGLGRGNPDDLPSELSSSDFVLGPILLEIERKLHPLELTSLEHHPPLFPEDMSTFKRRKRTLREEFSQLRSTFRAWVPLQRGKNLFERAYGMADRKEQEKLLNSALLQLRASRRLDPHGFRVSYYLGETYVHLARQDHGKPYNRFRLLQAQTSFLDSARQESINPDLLAYLAFIQHLLGRPKLAIKYYQEATQKFEKLPGAHYGEGQCHLILGDRAEAKRLLLKAVNSDLNMARERLETFTTLLQKHGSGYFHKDFPELAPEPPSPEETDPGHPEGERAATTTPGSEQPALEEAEPEHPGDQEASAVAQDSV